MAFFPVEPSDRHCEARAPAGQAEASAWRGASGREGTELSEDEQREAVEYVTDVEMPCDAATGVLGSWIDPMFLPTPSEPVWLEAPWLSC